MHVAIVIPARMASTRFPGKPLVDLMGKPMIQWVVEAACAAQVTDRVVVATPDFEILEACKEFGAEAFFTRTDHPSGTDRLAEVATRLKADVFVNVQGDEPLIKPETIRACVEPMLRNPILEMASVYCDCPEDEVENPAVVKVVTDHEGFALYFSRCSIPYPRNAREVPVKKHVGIYAYTDRVLERFSSWSMGTLEKAESLEQLRFLEQGIRIKMSQSVGAELAVDTPEQAEAVRAILALRQGAAR